MALHRLSKPLCT